ncbi:MAG: AtpZ/AtpI family protein [Elusimicrobiaceae bacterium]|nr:AtpZ/AtpI family protein [Elusimicrobiaceae bacterium]
MGKSRFISKKDFALISTLGIEFALIMCLGTFGGYYLDKKLSTYPWFLLLGALLGFAFALYVLIMHANLATQLEKTENKK